MTLRNVLGMDLLEYKKNNEKLYLLFIKNVPIVRKHTWSNIRVPSHYPKGPLRIHPDALEHWTGILLSTELEIHDGLINDLISLIDKRKDIADLLWDRLYFYNRIKPITDPKILYGNLYTKPAPESIDYGKPIMTIMLGYLGKAIVVEKTIEKSTEIVNAKLSELTSKYKERVQGGGIYMHDLDGYWNPTISQKYGSLNIDLDKFFKDVATTSIKPTSI